MRFARACFCLLAVLTVYRVAVDSRISCMDNDGKPVDWFIVYKLPVRYNLDEKPWPFPPHLYMDTNIPKFQLLTQTLNQTNQSVSYTLQQAYANHKSQNVGYILYNDEKPLEAGGGYTEEYGHTKGVTAFDKSSGFWLVHSVPKFPPPTNTSYNFASNAVFYGQHLLCISLNSTQDIQTLGTQLQMNEPWVYDYNLPVFLKLLYPVMYDVINSVKPEITSQIHTLTSYAGRMFTSFAKSAKFNQDLYSKMVTPTLRCNMSVETWQHGKKTNLPSVCQPFETENVQFVQNKLFNMNFSNYYDHSKYAVCQDNQRTGTAGSYVCIGDINRQTHQMVRGGGTVCFLDEDINKQYQNLIYKLESC